MYCQISCGDDIIVINGVSKISGNRPLTANRTDQKIDYRLVTVITLKKILIFRLFYGYWESVIGRSVIENS